MSVFHCPLCHKSLQHNAQAFTCPDGHSFDCAKSGYVNLLLPSDKHSKIPGDNKLMVAARQNFLNKGYYQPLAQAVCDRVGSHLAPTKRSLTILDTGCGEGYYTAQLHRYLTEQGHRFSLAGVDISKFTLDKAAKREKAVEFAVASVFHLPVGDTSCDMLLNMFAPYCASEAQRVIKSGGMMMLVIPGERHLLEMKQVLYDKPYANEAKNTGLKGFALIEQAQIEYAMTLPCAEDIDNLFKMTPYYYKTGKQDYDKLLSLSSLTVTAAFEIFIYKRQRGGEE